MRIVIPSFGRCGSTVVTFAVAAAFPELGEVFARHPSLFPGAGVVKTHCWAPKALNNEDRYVYVFGDPVLSAISAHQQSEAFQRLHYMHMGGNFELRSFWDTEDTLHIGQNYSSWRQHEAASNVMFLAYDDVFTSAGQDRLSDFLGRRICFPDRTPRQATFDSGNARHVNAARTYGGILV